MCTLTERLKAVFGRFTQQLTRRLDYQALYPGTVLIDHGNMTLDVRPDLPKVAAALPDLVEIPLKVIFPGLVSVKLTAGARVLVGFEHGDPSRPFAQPYSAADLELVVITTGKGQQITMSDDRGQRSGDNVYAEPFIEIRDQMGQFIKWTTTPEQEKIRAEDLAGNYWLLDSTPGAEKAVLADKAGNRVLCDAVANLIRLDTNTKVLINGGGVAVAKLGSVTSDGATIASNLSTQLEVGG